MKERPRRRDLSFYFKYGDLCCCCEFEAVATAQWSDLEVQRRILRVATIVDQALGSLMRSEDGYEVVTLPVSLAEV